MQKTYIRIICCAMIGLTGCASRSSFPTTFDNFAMQVYDNGKTYIQSSWHAQREGMTILQELYEEKLVPEDTGFQNSFIVAKMWLASGVSLQQIVQANADNLDLKLLKYMPLQQDTQNVECADTQYSWYSTTFSYQLGDEILYDGLYFFLDQQTLYMLSLSSDTPKDIQRFLKSLKTITCFIE